MAEDLKKKPEELQEEQLDEVAGGKNQDIDIKIKVEEMPHPGLKKILSKFPKAK